MPGSCAFSGVAAVHGLPIATHPPAVASRQTARSPINGFPRLDQSLASSGSREAYPTTRTRGGCSVANSFETPSSCRAFPGWRSEEIYRALTEVPSSVGARRALERTAMTMGAREGTRPEDDPFTHALSRKAETGGRMRWPRHSSSWSPRRPVTVDTTFDDFRVDLNDLRLPDYHSSQVQLKQSFRHWRPSERHIGKSGDDAGQVETTIEAVLEL